MGKKKRTALKGNQHDCPAEYVHAPLSAEKIESIRLQCKFNGELAYSDPDEFRSEFMDIYLIEKSAFFIGSTSGLWGIPYLFNTPQVNINHIPFHDATLGENDIWLPKKLWLVDKKRYMNFREILSIPRAQMLQGDFYINNRIEVIDNTSDEILEAVLEMLDKIDGKLSYTAEDDYYWSKLKNMYSKDSPAKYSLSRISKSFLKKYSNLLV